MNELAINNWQEFNKSYLIAELARVRRALEAKVKNVKEPHSTNLQAAQEGISEEVKEFPSLKFPALELLCRTFELSSFERDILLLCAGMEFDGGWALLCAEAQGDLQKAYPTFSLALAALPNPHWGALIPDAPLRRWRLIEIGAGNSLTTSLLRIDEQVLHYLTGAQHLDERLRGLAEPLAAKTTLVPSHQQIAQQLAATWLQSDVQAPVVQLCGEEGASKKAIAAAACHQLQLNLYALCAEALSVETSQLNLVKCLCEREWGMSQSVWLIDCDNLDAADLIRESAIARLAEGLNCPLIITTRDRRRQRERPQITFDVSLPKREEQQALWQTELGEATFSLNGHIESIVSHFSLSVPRIQSACWQFKTEPNPANAMSMGNRLWEICRAQARPRLEELATRIDSAAGWGDLVLPEEDLDILREIAAHVRQRTKVYELWGMARKSARGLGISALFAGASGTGKTLAAEVLGNALYLDVYRIDLSSVVSKYIGETEKNLRQIFAAAEGGGVILLFDEADALFGKRSDVKDSHDRYANMEVSYLLQRIESYRGLAVLTTNLKDAIDQAFLRRIRFIVQFPFPDANQRTEIWRRIFPQQTPTENLDYRKLAKLIVAGGNIRNIALNAAFLAADAGEAVQMKHILQAAKSEYVKLERPLTDVEVTGWV